MSDRRRITHADIRAYVGSTYFGRGLAYFEQGRVLSVDATALDHGGVRVRSRVSGSRGRPYAQSITIRFEP
jgi:uncharacterized Zn finger protein